MGIPQHRAERIESVVVEVETAPGSGSYVVDARLRARRVVQSSGERIGEALLTVRLDDGFDVLEARRTYSPDRRVVVRTDAAGTADPTVLFEGYPTRQNAIWEGGPKTKRNEYTIRADSVYARWAQDERAQVFGRYMRNAEIDEGLVSDPGTFGSRSVLVEGLPCVFNPDGVANRASEPLVVVDRDGVTRRVCVFTFDGDPDAVAWSWGDALRYLVWFHHLSEGPVSTREVFDATEPTVGVAISDSGNFSPASMLVRRLIEPADDLNVEATNLAEALALLADETSLHVACVSQSKSGSIRSHLWVWAAEDQPARRAPLAWGGRHADGTRRYDVDVLSASDILRDNVLRRVELDWDHSAIVNAPIVVGDVKRWEATVELVPGWLPETDLDNVAPVDRQDAKDLALTPDQVSFLGPDVELFPWYRKYHRNGSEFEDHRDVARMWVLNEDGTFDGAAYNRNAPFDDYQPFDFAAVISAVRTGEWTRRPRPMQKTITVAADGSKYGVHVEVSYDAGVNWYPSVGSVTVSKDRAGIWFGLTNPTSMIIPGGDWYDTNMWYALIDQVFRVRATAVFLDDARLTARTPGDSAHTPSLWRNSRVIYKPRDYEFASRQGTTNVLAQVNAGADGIEIDGTRAARSKAARVAVNERGAAIEAEFVIPWLDEAFPVGDRVSGICGRQVDLNGVLRVEAARDADWSITGKTFELGDGKFETSLALARRERGA